MWRQCARNVNTCFLEKKIRKISLCCLLKLLLRVQSFKTLLLTYSWNVCHHFTKFEPVKYSCLASTIKTCKNRKYTFLLNQQTTNSYFFSLFFLFFLFFARKVFHVISLISRADILNAIFCLSAITAVGLVFDHF